MPNIVIGITGSIAAYKSAYLIREFIKHDWNVKVVMTRNATKFISPLTIRTLSQNNVYIDLWENNFTTETELWTEHVNLAEWADVLLIAPATAHTIAKIAHGFCDNFITAIALSFYKERKYIAPAMDKGMWLNKATQRNINTLQADKWNIIAPETGFLASGLIGTGRMKEPIEIFQIITGNQPLKNKKVLITAGPTREPIDPVRFISNRSTGKMGIALAKASQIYGAKTTLITGPICLPIPQNVEHISIETAEEMFDVIQKIYENYDVIIMSAAVADFTPVEKHSEKLKKTGKDKLIIELRRTPDILKFLGEHKKPNQIIVGFALESKNDEKLALRKLNEKNADIIVFNSLAEKGAGFGYDTNKVIIFTKKDRIELPLMSKEEVAKKIIEKISELL